MQRPIVALTLGLALAAVPCHGAAECDAFTPFSALLIAPRMVNQNDLLLRLPSARATRLGFNRSYYLGQDAAADRVVDSGGDEPDYWGFVAAFPSGRHLTASWPWGDGRWLASLSPDGSRVAYRRSDESVVVAEVRPWHVITVLRFAGRRLLFDRDPHGREPTGDEPWDVDAIAWVGRQALWVLTTHDQRCRGRVVSIAGRPAILCSVRASSDAWCVGRGPRVVTLAGPPMAGDAIQPSGRQVVNLIERRGGKWIARTIGRVSTTQGKGNITGVSLAGDLLLIARDVTGHPVRYHTYPVRTRVTATDLRTGRQRWSVTYRHVVQFLNRDLGHGLAVWDTRLAYVQHGDDIWCVRVKGRRPKILRVVHDAFIGADDLERF